MKIWQIILHFLGPKRSEKRPRSYLALNASAQCTHENMSSRNHRLHDRVVDAVIAQFCTDFDCVRGSSLQGLREMIVRYVSELSIIARDEANCAGRTQVNVLDVFMALGRDAITFEHLLHQKASNQDGGLIRLPGKLSTTRKPKLWHKISNTTDAVPSYIPSYLQVLPSTDTRFLDTNIMLAIGNENIVDHVCSSKADEHKSTAKHIDALRSDWDIQNPDWQHSVRDSSSLMVNAYSNDISCIF